MPGRAGLTVGASFLFGGICMEQTAAVLLHDGALPTSVEAALGSLTHLQRIQADAKVCTAFQVVRLPTLILYDADHEETARAFGDVSILELIRQATTTTSC